jgi:hypothetical protein
MRRPKELFLVWQDGEDEQLYNQYWSLAEAVSGEGESAEIFEAKLTSLGYYKLVTKTVKTKKPKGNK